MFEQGETKSSAPEKLSFWRRQFSSSRTIPQLVYDVIFGIVLPILCFKFDPIVFSGRGAGTDIVPIAQFRSFVYLFSALSIVTLVVWLLTYRALKSAGGIIAGVLLSGAVCSLLIGVLILPLSIIGLMFIIGALGFTPFFTAFVYLRNGVRAMKSAGFYISYSKLVSSLLSGAFLARAYKEITGDDIEHRLAILVD